MTSNSSSGDIIDASHSVFNSVARDQYNITNVYPQPGQWNPIRYLIRRSIDPRDDKDLCLPSGICRLIEGYTVSIAVVLSFVLIFVHLRLGVNHPPATHSASNGPIRAK
jgi:hypothetical protein